MFHIDRCAVSKLLTRMVSTAFGSVLQSIHFNSLSVKAGRPASIDIFTVFINKLKTMVIRNGPPGEEGGDEETVFVSVVRCGVGGNQNQIGRTYDLKNIFLHNILILTKRLYVYVHAQSYPRMIHLRVRGPSIGCNTLKSITRYAISFVYISYNIDGVEEEVVHMLWLLASTALRLQQPCATLTRHRYVPIQNKDAIVHNISSENPVNIFVHIQLLRY